MNVLVSGGAGFIGSNCCELLVKEGHKVIVADNLLSGFYDNIAHLVEKGSVVFYEADIRNEAEIDKIFKNNEIHSCINFAALISVAESTEKPGLTEEINVLGLIKLLEICGRYKVKNFIHASSAAVYGDSEELPKIEDMLPVPKSPYAITKITGEYYNRYFAGIYGFKAVNCRFFNVFGPRQNPESQYAAAIPIFIKLASEGRDITIYGDGEQTRDFIYVEDLVSAIYYLMTRPAGNDKGDVYNLGYGKHITINKLVSIILKQASSSSRVKYESPRPGDIKYSYASVQRLVDSGWKENFGFDRGLEKTISWFMNHNK